MEPLLAKLKVEETRKKDLAAELDRLTMRADQSHWTKLDSNKNLGTG